jgi:hypothetical protein
VIEGYQDHLARFPNCAFATLAKARVEQLSAPVAKPSSEAPTPPPPTTPGPSVQADAPPHASTVALNDFTTKNNRDIDGNDIPMPGGRIGFQVADINECAVRCTEVPSCVALSFDRWKGACYLKGNVATSILDVRSTIAVKKPLQLPNVSAAQTKIEIVRNRKLRGDLIGRSADAPFDACKTKCDEDLRCLGFNFMKQSTATNRCEMFKLLEGHDSDNTIDGGYKTQATQ